MSTFAKRERLLLADLLEAEGPDAPTLCEGWQTRDLAVFDVYPLPDGRRSIGFRLTFQAEDRTLTDDEVNAIHARVARRVCDALGLTLRGA